MVPSFNRKIISGWINYSEKVKNHSMIESDMGYRGSKAGKLKLSVKEQRVDGSYPTLNRVG